MNNPTSGANAKFAIVSAFGAFFLWAGWAYIANASASTESRLLSAITQGTASFLITLFMVRAVSALYYRLPANRLRWLLPTLITVSLTGSGLFLIHWYIDTARILYTIAPALSVAVLFCLLTTYKLSGSAGETQSCDG